MAKRIKTTKSETKQPPSVNMRVPIELAEKYAKEIAEFKLQKQLKKLAQ